MTAPRAIVLRFAISNIPVRVHFSFLIIALLGPSRWAGLSTVVVMAVWTLAVFVAVLAHEAGHAFTARRFGAQEVSITLFALGGATMYPADTPMTPGRRFLISAAGSTVGIVLGGFLWLLWLADFFDSSASVVQLFSISFIWAALGWGLLNWIPIRPLDGGQMLTSALEIFSPKRGPAIARVISGVVGAGIVITSVVFELVTPTTTESLRWANRVNWLFIAIFVAFITYVGLQGDPAPPPGEPRRPQPSQPGAVVDLEPGEVTEHRPMRDPEPPEPPPAFPI